MLKSLFHWKVLLNMLLAAAVFAGLVWLAFYWLKFHTNHGKEIPVPNVVNMSVHKAIEALDDAGLDYEVDSFKYDPKYRPYQVLQIYPNPGARVKGGRAIILRVNPKTWAPVQVPDILDKYKGLAFRQLEAVGLSVGDTIYEPNIQRDAVIRMQRNGSILKPGVLLPRFSTIDLVIGTGPKRNVTVPNLIGLTVQEAKAVVANNLFEVGLVEYEDGRQDDSYIVYYQDPEGGSIRDQGMQIDLWASRKTPAEMGAKIRQLNSMYRVKMDTSLPPVRYEEIPVYQQPETVSPEPLPQRTPTLSSGKASEVKPAEDSKSSKSPAAEPAKSPEKPKTKKVIVE
ncbi:PASTA domain-containing protein [Bergeyella sp. RCAD1439]|uniref:PASTA domain-containing protein n=1 Tax=Bergeyella anatis TaxID=3113737 RepID=UPI002E17D7AD|nr:PASTA domain-containing protein [Bergeyella sp. RCAD1439]